MLVQVLEKKMLSKDRLRIGDDTLHHLAILYVNKATGGELEGESD